MAHRFDGLDLLALLVGLSLLGLVAWRLRILYRSQRDPEPAEEILEQHRYWAGVDLGNEHVGLSVYDSWEQRFIDVPLKRHTLGKSQIDAQLLLYQTLMHPDEPVTYIANEDQAGRVFAEMQQLHDDAMQAWIETREPGQQIPSQMPPGPVRFFGSTPLGHDDHFWHARGSVPDGYRFYNWQEIPEWVEDLDA